MSILNQVDGLLGGFEQIPTLSDADKAMIRQKREKLPAFMDGVSKYWETSGGKQTENTEDLRPLYEALRDSGAAKTAPFEDLAKGLDVPFESNILSNEELYRWGVELDRFSPRVPGTVAMDETAQYLTEKFESFGIETWSEPLDFRGVFFHEWSFDIVSPTSKTFVSFPENNVGFGDVEAELIDIGYGRDADYEGRDVRGKILLINWGVLWDHEGPCAARQRYGLLHLYDLAYSHGAAGMVGYFEDTPGNSLKIMEPGIKPTGGSNVFGQAEIGPDHQYKLPVLNIGREDGAAIKALLEKGETKARLVIKGVRKVSTTRSVIGFLPGLSETTIACAAHSCTAFEGAICDTVGVVGVLALAKYYSSLPIEKRKKSILFFFDSFHVWGNCCQTANLVLKKHATLASKVETFLWFDHLSDGKRDSERALLTSDNPVLWPLAALAMARRGILPTAIPIGRIWTMCANGPFERRGIPNMTMQSFGDDVLTTEDTWDKFDPNVLYRDVVTHIDIANALQELTVPAGSPGEPVGGCGSLFTGTDLPAYPPGESYSPEPSYPLYTGGTNTPVRILWTKTEKAEVIK